MRVKAPLFLLGLAALGAAWAGLPLMGGGHSFTLHMAMHMTVVAVAAPLLAFSLFERAGSLPLVCAPGTAVLASVVEFVVVWAWHAPALHAAARHSAGMLALEQGSFLAAGLLLWASATAGGDGRARQRTAVGVIALLATAMHMTLLGTLLALSPRPLYAAHQAAAFGLTPLEDQHLGGTVMLVVGGAAYLIGGAALMLRLLRQRDAATLAGEAP